MASSRVVEYVFFFGLMGIVGYIVFQMLTPFLSALALAAIIATICYPLHDAILRRLPFDNDTIAALITTIVVTLIVVLPLVLLTSAVLREAVSVYSLLGSEEFSFSQTVADLESYGQKYIPSLELNITEYLRQGAKWFSSRLGSIFAGTASTIFLFFIALIGSFYFFRDGRAFTRWLVRISPLPDNEDTMILERLSRSVRSVATGTLFIALIQGTLVAIGLAIFGFERAILLGTVAAFGALIPSIGTSIVLIPSIIYLLIIGDYGNAVGLTIWGSVAVGLIDNILGPYLMSRGNALHPFVILLTVLGGIGLFGPIGFVVGPVLVSFFLVLLELYNQHIAEVSHE